MTSSPHHLLRRRGFQRLQMGVQRGHLTLQLSNAESLSIYSHQTAVNI
jgi:hypothetical protein